MHSSQQVQATHYADMSLSVHDRINDLHRRADRLAPRLAEETLDAGCTNLTVREHGSLGPRQQKAWDMVAEAHGWNAISDTHELLAQAEQYERDGISYRIAWVGREDLNASPFEVVTEPTEAPQCPAGSPGHACVLDDDGHTEHCDGGSTWTDPEPTTATVPTGQLRVGDVVLNYGMRVRIDAINPYPGQYGPAWSCPGTVLNVAEVLAAEVVPASFMTREGRRDYCAVQGNYRARWTVELPRPEVPADPEPTGPEPQGEAETADLFVTADDGHRTRSLLRDGEVVAFIRWSGDVIKVYFPGGTILGRLYRSDGKRVAGEIIYTYRAWTASDRLEIRPADTEVARGASLPGAGAALLQHAADAHPQAAAQDADGQPHTNH